MMIVTEDPTEAKGQMLPQTKTYFSEARLNNEAFETE
jgi:hypothetical protein